MNFIELNSVGSTVTNEGLVFPQDISEAPETSSEADEMGGVNVFETTDEWIPNCEANSVADSSRGLENTLNTGYSCHCQK